MKVVHLHEYTHSIFVLLYHDLNNSPIWLNKATYTPKVGQILILEQKKISEMKVGTLYEYTSKMIQIIRLGKKKVRNHPQK